jgi:hypothetical protein
MMVCCFGLFTRVGKTEERCVGSPTLLDYLPSYFLMGIFFFETFSRNTKDFSKVSLWVTTAGISTI